MRDVDQVMLGFTDDGTMREVARVASSEFECSQLAACPFVYVMGDDTAVFAGEILRNLRGSDAHALQGLELPASQARVLRPGDILDVDFDLPSTSARLTLFARGYYIPTPTAQTRRDGL